jgi:hypothetical protein
MSYLEFYVYCEELCLSVLPSLLELNESVIIKLALFILT